MDVLLQILILLVISKIGGEITEYLGYPSIIGELCGGILVGPTLLGLVSVDNNLERFAYIGILLLMFLAGAETSISDLSKTGRVSVAMAILGVFFPFTLGAIVTITAGYSIPSALFIGTALSATSVGITVRVLYELGELHSTIGSTIIGSAILDDILAVILVTVITGAVVSDSVSLLNISKIIFFMALFFTIAYFVMHFFVIKTMKIIHEFRTESAIESWALIFVLGFAILAEELYVAGITGSFVAGMIIARTPEKNIVITNTKTVGYAFFIPFFFATIGAQVDISNISDIGLYGVSIIIVAIVGKIIGSIVACYMSKYPKKEAITIGVGMIPRMEVALVIGNMGIAVGVMSQSLYSSIIVMALVTTLLTPPLLKLLIRWMHNGRPAHLS